MDNIAQSPEKDNALISYEGVVISHDGNEIIKDVTFSVYPQDFIFLTGHVGSGKSSILRTIYKDIDISAGKGFVLGYDLSTIRRKQIPELRKQLGIIFQDCKLLGNLTIIENLAFILRATGAKQKNEINEKIDETLKLVELEDKSDKYPNELSGGEQQRAAIARAIINNPKVILADEPTGNLDKNAAINITRLLGKISESGAAVIMSTHNLDLVKTFTGKVFQCKEGTFHNTTDEYTPTNNNTDITE